MRKSHLAVRVGLLTLAALGLLLWKVHTTSAAGQIPMTVNVYFQVVDEQNTTAFYNNGTAYCSGSNASIGSAFFDGDIVNGPTSAYNFVPPWTLSTNLSSSQYVSGTYCSTSNACLSASFNKNQSTLSLDTRNSLGPRKVGLSFSAPCLTCSLPGGAPSFGSSVNTPVLVSIFLNTPYTSMSVCSSTTCPEAEPAFAKLWFTDPTNSQVTWRVDWTYLRVLRMSTGTWYVLADACDGSQIAGLYRLQNQRNKVTTSFQGYYLIPFFLSAAK
ncbi:MAG: hypothetical protein LAP13_23430 [Acidobacteriia bacterium]|nr:hypothetical protein [Terriglobia bacterium]